MITFFRHASSQTDSGLDYLLSLNGEVQGQNEEGYYIQFDVIAVKASRERPHGIKYSLTLHDPWGKRLMGFDNAHGQPARDSSMRANIIRLIINTATPAIPAWHTNSIRRLRY